MKYNEPFNIDKISRNIIDSVKWKCANFPVNGLKLVKLSNFNKIYFDLKRKENF